MLPVERRNRIKNLIQERQNMKISELSELLKVSEMTIHRDLKPLIEEGFVSKSFGGVTWSEVENESPHSTQSSNTCVICQRAVCERLAYRIIRNDNQIEMACCAHCGLLRHQQLGSDVMQAICHDFLRQTTISAGSAWYVMDTSVQIDCCQPQVLTFELQEHAEKFVTGFGGQVFDFTAATERLHQKMKEHGSGCPHHD
ncbi:MULTISPECIES: DeoR family transcriptional regulator [unclassified Virgibacillus]|uniref:DeoR family transcriptional regulator n=1 Tax=unclassified Virgibacillus TaxID=2620237 RepID=UPI0024DE13D0|nr:DeoR family transcriptional regulator [Virgibacillus sp. LDC-1]